MASASPGFMRLVRGFSVKRLLLQPRNKVTDLDIEIDFDLFD